MEKDSKVTGASANTNASTSISRHSYPLRKVHWRVPKLMAKSKEKEKSLKSRKAALGTSSENSSFVNTSTSTSNNAIHKSAKMKMKIRSTATGKENMVTEPSVSSSEKEMLNQSESPSSSSSYSLRTIRKNMLAQVGVTPARTRAKTHLKHMLMHASNPEMSETSTPVRSKHKQSALTKLDTSSNSSTEDIRQMLDLSSIAESPIEAANVNGNFDSLDVDTHSIDFDNETNISVNVSQDETDNSQIIRNSNETKTNSKRKTNEVHVLAHPSYGKLLHDFGFKKLYLACGKTLCNSVPIWHLQRPCDRLRMLRIAECKKGNSSFPGVISIFDFGRNCASIDIPQVCGVFDGQHRILAINEILKQHPETEIHVLVEVFPVETQEDVKRWFLEINKAEMVQEIDLPDKIAPENRRIIDEVCDSLRSAYPEIITTNNRCRPPNLCIDRFRNRLFQEGVLEKCSILTEKDLYFLIMKVNDSFSERKHNQWPPTVHRNLKKAKRCKFFLGLTDEWLDEMLKISSPNNKKHD
uniref:Uncharacterized protein n=1 Tax=Aplanochytrium stocchinoi TaxID=215587 RepID=A0A7S3PE18_9STRA